MSTRREFTISPEYCARFLAAADAGPVAGTGARQLGIWCEMAWVTGFEVGTVEPVPGHPTLFIAEPIDTGCKCNSASLESGAREENYRCPDRPVTAIDGDPLCARHAEWVRADNARIAAEEAAMSVQRRSQIAYDREVIRRIEVEARDASRFARSVRS